MEALVQAYCVWLHFFNLPPNTEREKNHLNVARCLCRQLESNPGCLHSKPVRYPLLHCLLFGSTLPSIEKISFAVLPGVIAGLLHQNTQREKCWGTSAFERSKVLIRRHFNKDNLDCFPNCNDRVLSTRRWSPGSDKFWSEKKLRRWFFPPKVSFPRTIV